MRRLQGGIPRGLRSHRGVDGALYTGYARALVARFDSLDRAGLALVREAGRVVVELGRVARDQETARSRANGKREERRLRRAAASLRGQLLALERRLEELAGTKPTLAQTLSGGPGGMTP